MNWKNVLLGGVILLLVCMVLGGAGIAAVTPKGDRCVNVSIVSSDNCDQSQDEYESNTTLICLAVDGCKERPVCDAYGIADGFIHEGRCATLGGAE